MPIKACKPTSAGRRGMTLLKDEALSKTKPEKSLTGTLLKTGGRNNLGRMTSRHRGAGHKRQYRIIDFGRAKEGMSARVLSIQYDPNRTARIALVQYQDGVRAYIVAPEGLKAGDEVVSGAGADVKPGQKIELFEGA